MKTSILYAYVALMGIASAQEPCEDGKRVTISPGYRVEYRCNKFRSGGLTHSNIASHEDCAAICQTGNVEVCTYHAGKRKCLVGDPNGAEGTRDGATYIIRVPEDPVDPFPEDGDPFPETCEEQRDDFKKELEKCRAERDAAPEKPNPPPPSPPSCGVNQSGQGAYYTRSVTSLAACKNACNADPKCLSYSVTNSGASFCYLFDKETVNVPATQPKTAQHIQYDKRCG